MKRELRVIKSIDRFNGECSKLEDSVYELIDGEISKSDVAVVMTSLKESLSRLERVIKGW